jgi:molecular chaperone GrpE
MAENTKESPICNNSNKPNEGCECKNKGASDQKEGAKHCCGQKEVYETKIIELTDTLKRLQAEFENYQKRNSRQNDEFKLFANAKLIEELLPVLDSLEIGMQHSKDLVIVHEQIYGILKKNGLEKISAQKGQKFDHDKMECLMQECNPSLKEGAIANVLMNGYLLNGKILRLTKVSVNTLESKEKNEEHPSGASKKENVGEEKEEVTKVDFIPTKMEG